MRSGSYKPKPPVQGSNDNKPQTTTARNNKKPQTTPWRTQTESAHIARLRAAREARTAKDQQSLYSRPETNKKMAVQKRVLRTRHALSPPRVQRTPGLDNLQGEEERVTIIPPNRPSKIEVTATPTKSNPPSASEVVTPHPPAGPPPMVCLCCYAYDVILFP